MATNTYECAICGKSYDTIKQRSACETKCSKLLEAETAQKKKQEEKERYMKSEKAIIDILTQAEQMVKEHLEKYETLSLNQSYYYLSYLFKKSHWYF